MAAQLHKKLKYDGSKMPFPVSDPLVVIVGPTAVGKTRLAIEIARRLNGEIVSADSRLFYRGMDIGTAKPSGAMQAMVPHHLVDIAEPDECISLQIFQKKANDCIQEIHARSRLPILVGGTGQYIRAITQGWSIPLQKPNERLRQVIADWLLEIGPQELFEKLKLLDPAAAEKMDYRNHRRTIRAIEVIFGTGRLFSDQRGRRGAQFSIIEIGLTLPREQLFQMIDDRIDQMLINGLVEEVEALLNKGFSIDLPSMSAIGYHEIAEYIQNKISLEAALVLMKRRSHQFVRRQGNWFKTNDPCIQWFSANPLPIEKIIESIKLDHGWQKKDI
jgi:tRNA dimethylallyltransferase